MALRSVVRRLVVCALVVGIVPTVQAENWPQWRGPRLDGVSLEKNLPAEFGPNKNVAWRTPLPGQAGATPVVWDNRIFVSSVDGAELVLLAFETSNGKQLWRQVVGKGNRTARGDEGNSASPSPSTDGKHVWVFFGSGDLACYDVAGSEVWKQNVQDEYGRFQIQFGMSSTPVLHNGRLYMQLIHSGGAQVLAIDGATGKNIWKVNRPSDARAECEHSYASPTLYRDDKQEFLISHGADYVIAHDLKDGSEIWRAGGLNIGRYDPTLRFVASPVAVPGLIVVPSAKGKPLIAIKPMGKGDITGQQEHIPWVCPRTPDVPSPLVVDGLVYLCLENGNLIVLDAESGERYYGDVRTHVGRHRASPLYADGKVYLTARDGTITVIKPGKKFEVLATNQMGEDMSSSPIVSNGTMYLRTFDALYAVRSTEQAAR
jgi:outer membrane protein assembly factor BamB